MRNKFLFFLVAGVFIFTSPVLAQETLRTGSVFGKVIDDKGAPLPGVNVTIESDVIRPLTATTGPTGTFRFATLPPAVYGVNFSLEGFTEVRQEGVRVSTGSTVELSITLRPSLAEEFTVIGETPVVDTASVSNTDVYDKVYLEKVPSGRDPWVILEQTPGVDVDRVSVAGSEAGQQSIFFSRGSAGCGTGWNYDGINITDPSAAGASPTYFDFDAFEEIAISTGGQDSSVQTGDITLNFVTKRPGNKWQANASYYFTSDGLQSDKAPEGLEETLGNRIDEIKSWGFDIGGPAVKDKLFGWFAYKKEEIGLFKFGTFDFTELKDLHAKAIFNANAENESSFTFFKGDKIKNGRAGVGPDLQAPETLWDQGGPGEIPCPNCIISVGHTYIPNDNTIVSGKYGYIGLGFSLISRGGNDVPMIILSAIPRWEQTFLDLPILDRPAHDVTADVNYFKENWGGGDHEFKFGFEYKVANIHSVYTYGNGVYIHDYEQTVPGGPLTNGYLQARHWVDGRNQSTRASFYAQDTYRLNRLTLNLGLRFDHQGGKNQASSIPGVPGFEADVGPIDYAGDDGPAGAFNDISPRIGATYDITGDGKTVIRGNFARYYDGFSTFTLLNYSNPTFLYNSGAEYDWVNLNGDRTITPNEITGGPNYYGGLTGPIFDLEGFLAQRLYDPDLHNSGSWEVLAGFERQLMPDMSFGITYTYRKYVDLIQQVPFGVTSDDFVPAGNFNFTAVNGETFNVPIFKLGFEHDGRLIVDNIEDYSQVYHGVDLTVRKRMSNNFLLNGGFTWQRQRGYYDSPAATSYQYITDGGLSGATFPYDPGTALILDGSTYAFATGGSGKSGIYPFAEWTFKASGVYQFPWDISVGTFVRYQQGYPLVIFGSFSDPTLVAAIGTGTHRIFVEEIGARRLDNLFTFDLSFQKGFELGQAGRITLAADIFNVLNEVTVLDRQRAITGTTFLNTRENLSPRAIRLGIRYGF